MKEQRVLTVAQTRENERRAEENGLSEDVLIENAAAAVVADIKKNIKRPSAVAVFVGSGNNAADGLSVARMLHLDGYKTEVVTLTDKLNEYSRKRLDGYRYVGGKVVDIKTAKLRADFYKVIVDAVFGIGLCREVEGVFREAIELINAANATVVSVDIPSGLSAVDGFCMGVAVKADTTVTFGSYKYGHLLGQGADYCGKLVLSDIGITADGGAVLCDETHPYLPPRKKVSHKGDYGRVRIIGGSGNMIGAPLMSCESAVFHGAGLVTLCAASSLMGAYRERVKEEMLLPLPGNDGNIIFDKDALDGVMSGADTICIGMGMGANPELLKILQYLCFNFRGRVVVDADGLNALTGKTDMLKGHKCELILTPHRGEFYRLFGETKESDIVDKTFAMAASLNAVIVNKSNTTIITDGKEIYLNTSGSPTLARGGSGDKLVGAIAAYSARIGSLKGSARAAYECGKLSEKE